MDSSAQAGHADDGASIEEAPTCQGLDRCLYRCLYGGLCRHVGCSGRCLTDRVAAGLAGFRLKVDAVAGDDRRVPFRDTGGPGASSFAQGPASRRSPLQSAPAAFSDALARFDQVARREATTVSQRSRRARWRPTWPAPLPPSSRTGLELTHGWLHRDLQHLLQCEPPYPLHDNERHVTRPARTPVYRSAKRLPRSSQTCPVR